MESYHNTDKEGDEAAMSERKDALMLHYGVAAGAKIAELEFKSADLEGSIAVRGVHIKFLEKENEALKAKLAAIKKAWKLIEPYHLPATRSKGSAWNIIHEVLK